MVEVIPGVAADASGVLQADDVIESIVIIYICVCVYIYVYKAACCRLKTSSLSCA